MLHWPLLSRPRRDRLAKKGCACVTVRFASAVLGVIISDAAGFVGYRLSRTATGYNTGLAKVWCGGFLTRCSPWWHQPAHGRAGDPSQVTVRYLRPGLMPAFVCVWVGVCVCARAPGQGTAAIYSLTSLAGRSRSSLATRELTVCAWPRVCFLFRCRHGAQQQRPLQNLNACLARVEQVGGSVSRPGCEVCSCGKSKA